MSHDKDIEKIPETLPPMNRQPRGPERQERKQRNVSGDQIPPTLPPISQTEVEAGSTPERRLARLRDAVQVVEHDIAAAEREAGVFPNAQEHCSRMILAAYEAYRGRSEGDADARLIGLRESLLAQIMASWSELHGGVEGAIVMPQSASSDDGFMAPVRPAQTDLDPPSRARQRAFDLLRASQVLGKMCAMYLDSYTDEEWTSLVRTTHF